MTNQQELLHRAQILLHQFNDTELEAIICAPLQNASIKTHGDIDRMHFEVEKLLIRRQEELQKFKIAIDAFVKTIRTTFQNGELKE
jgi:hypothetical protein